MKDDELYISSMSPTIGVKEQRGLMEISRNMAPMLTYKEWLEIMKIYNSAVDRLFEENGVNKHDTTVTE